MPRGAGLAEQIARRAEIARDDVARDRPLREIDHRGDVPGPPGRGEQARRLGHAPRVEERLHLPEDRIGRHKPWLGRRSA